MDGCATEGAELRFFRVKSPVNHPHAVLTADPAGFVVVAAASSVALTAAATTWLPMDADWLPTDGYFSSQSL